MARRLQDKNLQTRTARSRLKARRNPHWRSLGKGRHLGYRRRRGAPGTWTARLSVDGRRYVEHRLGLADDHDDADGHSVLSFDQAVEAARAWFSDVLDPRPDRGEPYSVADAVSDYLLYMRARKSHAQVEQVARLHILPELGCEAVVSLTVKRVRQWHRDLAEKPARRRSSPAKVNTAPPPSTVEQVRQRRETSNRCLSVLRAALNRAAAEEPRLAGLAQLPWRAVEPFKGVSEPRVAYLPDAESRRLVNAADGDFRKLLVAALLTGLRYGELCRLRVADFDAEAAVLRVAHTKSHRTRFVHLDPEAVGFFEELAAGRTGGALMLERNGRGWQKSEQQRPMREACERARIEPPVGFHVTRHSYASRLARRGVPLQVVAQQLGHTTTAITERVYAHLSPASKSSHLVGVPELRVVAPSKVTRLKPRRSR